MFVENSSAFSYLKNSGYHILTQASSEIWFTALDFLYYQKSNLVLFKHRVSTRKSSNAEPLNIKNVLGCVRVKLSYFHIRRWLDFAKTLWLKAVLQLSIWESLKSKYQWYSFRLKREVDGYSEDFTRNRVAWSDDVNKAHNVSPMTVYALAWTLS